MDFDHGSNRALGSAALQLVGGVLIGCAIALGYRDGLDNPISIGLGGLASMYFVVSGCVRLYVAFVTRRSDT